MKTSKLMALRKLYRLKTTHAGTKSKALAIYKARKNHKKLPEPAPKKPEISDYKKMSIDEYEQKYG